MTIVCKDILTKYRKILRNKKNNWSTIVGTFNTFYVTYLNLELPELNHTAEFCEKCHLTKQLLNCDLILGRDILHEVDIILNF